MTFQEQLPTVSAYWAYQQNLSSTEITTNRKHQRHFNISFQSTTWGFLRTHFTSSTRCTNAEKGKPEGSRAPTMEFFDIFIPGDLKKNCGLFQGFYLQLRISGLQSLSLVIKNL